MSDHEHHDHEHHGHEDDHHGGHHHNHHNHDHHNHDHHDGGKGHDPELHHEHDVDTLGFAVVTVSTSREVEDDPSGDTAVALVEDAGHEVVERKLVGDERDAIQALVNDLVDDPGVDVVVTNGGTGVTPDDVTVEAVESLLEKDLPGFGELFRRLSYDEIGTRVVGTRAIAGTVDGTVAFCLPGSEAAVRLGVSEVVVPEAPHLAGLAQRDRSATGHDS